MYICGCKRMLMPQDWINVHTHRPGEGVNIVDPCLGSGGGPECACSGGSAVEAV